jgi:uncharacterized protein YdaU (DUF1376 family)
MSGLPFLQFYPGDWLKDTRALSPEAKGAWIDILCALHFSPTRGTLAMTIEGWARMIGQSPEKTRACINELTLLGTCDCHECNGDVTLECRRMLRESITKEQTRLRVEKKRLRDKRLDDETRKKQECNGKCNAPVPKCNGEEARSQKPETITYIAPATPDAVKKPKAEKAPRPRNPIFDALAEVTETNPEVAGGELGKALSAIKALSPDVTVEEIRVRFANCKTYMPDCTPGPMALAKWWPKCIGAKVNGHYSRPTPLPDNLALQ